MIIKGRVAALLELGSGFNLEFTGKENIYLNGKILGLSHKQIQDKYQEIVDFADIGDFIDRPVKTYSSGMFVRLAFAVQAHIDASIIIIDEALAVGDIFFRQKCYARLEGLKKSGAVIILVTHSMADIEQYCDKVLVLNKGEQVFLGSASEAAKRYYLLHQEQLAFVEKVDSGSIHALDSFCGGDISSIKIPPKEAFIDISENGQVSLGKTKCISLAICDDRYRPTLYFRQGDEAIFFFQFEVLDLMEVPVCGLTISNEKGVLVFGKNGWQYDVVAPLHAPLNSIISCRQSARMDLAPGEYIAEVGLVTTSRENWLRKRELSHQQMEIGTHRICALSRGVVFSVGLAQIAGKDCLTHHGITNLSGNMSVTLQM
jgi:lipopolysaccharide transport system ATP-binding protein